MTREHPSTRASDEPRAFPQYEDEDVVREQLQDDFERQLDREAGWGI